MLVSPDGFTGTLRAIDAAESIKSGWLKTNPNDEVVLLPMSDGGPGFVESIACALGATKISMVATGVNGDPVPAQIAVLGQSAWIESAQVCGISLGSSETRNLETATSYGLGELIRQAVAQGATNITIGLGGTACNDGGAGMLAALGATSVGALLTNGGLALRDLTSVDLRAVIDLLDGVSLTAASDVDNPFLGLRGATAIYAPQKGANDELVMLLEGAMENLARVLGKRFDGRDAAVALGAGAAGGIGFALIHLGATRIAGIATVMEIIHMDSKINDCDLVITGEGCLDDQSLSGKVVAGVAAKAASFGKPCIALAGEVRLGKRECSSAGIDSAYSIKDLVGLEESMTKPSESLSALAARVARTWGRF